MATVGERVDFNKINRSYEKDSMHKLAEQFLDVARGALHEDGIDIYKNPDTFFMHQNSRDNLKDFFVNEMYDPADPEMRSPEAIQEYENDLGELFQNDIDGIRGIKDPTVGTLNENAPLGSFNPVIGISFPMHKNLLMSTVFDKGAIPKQVAVSPKFTLTMETRTLVDTNGNEIDIFLEQDKIHAAIRDSVPQADVYVALPENNVTDLRKKILNSDNPTGDLSILTAIEGIVVTGGYVDIGDEYVDKDGNVVKASAAGDLSTVAPDAKGVLVRKHIEFVSSYGEYDRIVMDKVETEYKSAANNFVPISVTISGYMKKNMFMLNATDTKVTGLLLHAVMDVSSAAFDEPHVKWSARTDLFQIPEAPHIATNVSPEEVKDINALYQVNQLTKIMSIMNLSLVNYKDDEIHHELDQSFLRLPNSQKVSGSFDFLPPTNYLADPISWRQTMFMDYLDTQVTQLLQVLNDENMTITVFGRPDLIRKITPTEYTYQTPSSIGPVELDFKKTVVTSDKRVYQFISSQKLRDNNNLILILCPRNTQRVIYKIFDYQFYVSNEIRTTKGYQLPAITAFERWKMIEYQPIQGRIQIKNPLGLREVLDNDDPIGTSAMNDYTANKKVYASQVNGGIARN